MTTEKPEHEPVTEPQKEAPEAGARRPYAAPRLRHLGSVRELTLGSAAGKSEGAGLMHAKGAM
jgi:hypothetical protein